MPDGLYERDALAWAEQQADLLTRLAAGERVNAAIDWSNVIEEVRDVGLSELRACQSLLLQGILHLLKLHAWPDSAAAAHWREEIRVFLVDANVRSSPSMRQRMDIQEEYELALEVAREATDDSGPPRPLPENCRFTLDELLARDVTALLAKLAASGKDQA